VAEHPDKGVPLSSELAEHVPVGRTGQNSPPEKGPDLSFLIIRDQHLLEKIQTVEKAFFDLDVAPPPLHPILNTKVWWGITGTFDDSFGRVDANHNGVPLSKLANFVGAGNFSCDYNSTQEEDFDYIKIKVPAGHFEFPHNYNGISGGGFWLMPMEVDPNEYPHSVRHRPPILTGVEFAQFEPDRGERVLIGHGPNSIYIRLKHALKQHVALRA